MYKTDSIQSHDNLNEEEIKTSKLEDETEDKSTPKSFRYLDDLIHNGQKEIILDADIILNDEEEREYSAGIKLDVDDFVIDGRGHAIDARKKTRIFYCTGKNITIKNIVFKCGFANRGGAIFSLNEENLTLTGCEFKDNLENVEEIELDEYSYNDILHRYCDDLWLKNETEKYAYEMYGEAIRNESIICMDDRLIIATCLYVACLENKELCGMRDIADVANIGPSKIARAYRLMMRELNSRQKNIIKSNLRQEDIIKSSGYNIKPSEVKDAVLSHEAVKSCAITACPHEVRGQIVKAIIVLRAGYEPSDKLTKEIQHHVKSSIAPYKYPRMIEYVDEIPKQFSEGE